MSLYVSVLLCLWYSHRETPNLNGGITAHMIFLSELFVKACVDEDSLNFSIYYSEPQDSEMEEDEEVRVSNSCGWEDQMGHYLLITINIMQVLPEQK